MFNLLAAATMVVATPQGPALEPLPPPMEQVVSPELEDKIKPPGCYKPSRIFNIVGQAADIGTTIYAVEKRGFQEVGPLARPIIGKHPKPWEVVAFKAVPFIAIDALGKHFLKSKNPSYACSTHIGWGLPAWYAGISNFMELVK